MRNLSTSAGVDLVSLANRPSEPDSSRKLQKAIRALQQNEADRNNAPFGLPPPLPFHPPARRLEGIFEGVSASASLKSLYSTPLTSRYTQRFAGKSAGPTLAAQFLDDHCEGATIQVEEQVSLVEHLIGRGQNRPSSASFALPPVELVQLLVDAYFTQFNSQMPMLHRPSFNRALFSGKADSDPGFRSLRESQGVYKGSDSSTNPSSSPVFVVLALGARWAQDPRIRGDWSAKALYAASCCESPVGEHASERSTLFDLQASTLAVVHLLGAETSVQAWTTGGLASEFLRPSRRSTAKCLSAVRKFIDVGAHLETTEWWTRSPLIDQLRKRAFHLLFTFDRELFIPFLSARQSELKRPARPQVSAPLHLVDRWRFKILISICSTRTSLRLVPCTLLIFLSLESPSTTMYWIGGTASRSERLRLRLPGILLVCSSTSPRSPQYLEGL